MQNRGVGQRNIAQLVALAADTDAHYSDARTRNILVVWIGANDCISGLDATTSYEAVRDYCQARRDFGWEVIVATVAVYGSGYGTEAVRVSFNDQIRTNWATFADGLADIGATTHLSTPGDENNGTYYFDVVHLTAAGYGLVADVVYDAILALP